MLVEKQCNRLVLEALEHRVLLAAVPEGFVDQPWGGTLTDAMSMEFAPDGRLFVTTQLGTVRVISASGSLLSTPALTLPVESSVAMGLMGITFDPAFGTSNNFVYLYYTVPGSGGGQPFNRVSRFTVTGNTIDPGSEEVLVSMNALYNGYHNGGGMHFGGDGKLYLAVGDDGDGSTSVSLSYFNGKVLRMNTDPANMVPPDNPTSFSGIEGTTTGPRRLIWAAGLRNPFTFAVHPVTGQMLLNDVGENAWEEVNELHAGQNYGWPSTEGDFNPTTFPALTRPIHAYPHGSGVQSGYAVTGSVFYESASPNSFPAPYDGQYFFGDYVNRWIGYIDPLSPVGTTTHSVFATDVFGLVDLDVGADGALYYLSRESGVSGGNPIAPGVRRIIADSSLLPSIITQPQNASVFDGQTVVFQVTAAGAAPLSYQWTRDDVDIPGATSASFSLVNAQSEDSGAVFRCRVSNQYAQVTSNPATLTVTVDGAPVPQIDTPQVGALYTAGDTIVFSGSATDPEDGTLAPSAFLWRVDFHHDAHWHPFMPPTGGITGGQFVIPTTNEVDPDVWYRIHLTVVDSLGRAESVFRDVNPRTSTITVNTSGAPDGLTINIDAQPRVVPTSFIGVAGIVRNLDAPLSQTIGGQTYNFVSWSDGGTANHDISTQLVDTTYTAVYLDVTNPVSTGGTFDFEGANLPQPPHRARFAFSEDVSASLSLADFVVEDLDNSVVIPAASLAYSYDSVTNVASIAFPGFADGVLPDGDYRVTLLSAGVADVAGNALTGGNVEVTFFVLAGDATRNRSVNGADFNILATNFGTNGKTFSQGNFSYDAAGIVDSADFNILATNFGVTLVGEGEQARGSSGLPGGAGGAGSGSSSLFGGGWIGDDDDLEI